MPAITYYINHLIGFFINNKTKLTREELNQKTILIQILLTILFMNIVFFSFELMGYFNNELTLGLFIFAGLGLTIIKFSSSNFLIGTYMSVTLSLTAIVNVCETGYIYSYNNKWFIVLLLLVNMASKNQTTLYLFFYLFLQFVFYHYTTEDLSLIADKEEYLVDNFFAIVLGYSFIQFFNRLEALQRGRIDKQNLLLVEQKHELVESNELLKKQSQKLLLSNQELERFAYIASHDLKSPLNNIINFSSLLQSELKNTKNLKAAQYVNFIKAGSVKMNILIEDVLEYSKLSSDSVSSDKTDLNLIVQSITGSISEYIRQRNAQVSVNGTLPTIRANKTKMYLLFKNIIENGIKYNQSVSPLIEISFKKDESAYLFSIKDNGIGISKEYHHKIFDMFARLHGDSKYEGTGLGLALCKKIILSLEGEISVVSEENKGAEFRIKIDKKYFVAEQVYSSKDFEVV